MIPAVPPWLPPYDIRKAASQMSIPGMWTHPAYLRLHSAFFHRPLVSAFARDRPPELPLCLGSLTDDRRLLLSLNAGQYAIV